jgi:putative Mg2+ transporter-C (MgtC) family protein
METLLEEFAMPETNQMVRVFIRLMISAILGGVLGLQREKEGKPAGLQTHMLVATGATMFTLAPLEASMTIQDLSRVIQGVATGIGFIGAGTILKLTEQREITGLTTAAGLWLTAAIGMAVGAGRLWLPVLGMLLAMVVLSLLGALEARMLRNGQPSSASRTPKPGGGA